MVMDALITGNESQPIIDFLKSKFQLSHVLAETIAYGIAFCNSPAGKSRAKLPAHPY